MSDVVCYCGKVDPADKCHVHQSRSLEDLVTEVIAVQDASNLSGVAQSFARAMLDLRRLPDCTGTEWCNNHAITRAWIDKLASLAGMQFDPEVARKAHADCANLSTALLLT